MPKNTVSDCDKCMAPHGSQICEICSRIERKKRENERKTAMNQLNRIIDNCKCLSDGQQRSAEVALYRLRNITADYLHNIDEALAYTLSEILAGYNDANETTKTLSSENDDLREELQEVKDELAALTTKIDKALDKGENHE